MTDDLVKRLRAFSEKNVPPLAKAAMMEAADCLSAQGEAVAYQWRNRNRKMVHEEVWSYVDYCTGLKIAEHPGKYETRPLYLALPSRELGLPSRDELGRAVREAWVKWATTQPHPKASWLVPYDDLDEADKEADRQIGEAIVRRVDLREEGLREALTLAANRLARCAVDYAPNSVEFFERSEWADEARRARSALKELSHD